MSLDAITWDGLSEFEGAHVAVFGTDKNATAMVEFMRAKHPGISIDFFLSLDPQVTEYMGLPVLTVPLAREKKMLEGARILIAQAGPMAALHQLLDDAPAEIRMVSRQLHSIFHGGGALPGPVRAEKKVTPFFLERGTPRIPAVLTNGYITDGPAGSNVFELADFDRQEYVTWTIPSPNCPYSLNEFSRIVPQDALPMRMSHVAYLLWKRGIHVAQLSPSKRWLVGVRYNYFFLNILDTESGEVICWHDRPQEEGLWDYVATGDFDGDKDEFMFVRWPLKDAIQGMCDGTNRVHCQVGRLDLNTMKAEILHEFDFQDRIHQCTISGDGRYMVFAPMRVLRPGGDPKKLRQEDIMRNLQRTVVLDSMATLDLRTGRVWTTRIPYPIPAHFELDPFDPHVFYVSTHSLMPYADGVLCFQPGTLHKMRILDGETVMEGTYTHPGFIRTTQHCVFAWRGVPYIAATNQNKLEIIDARTMTLWHCHTIADDPFYDNADFNNPEFLKKPFKLPGQPAWCGSVSASGDGATLILYLAGHFCLFDMESKTVTGNVMYRADRGSHQTHGRYWMQNAPAELQKKAYGLR
ncbi:MAG: hypothetical protein J1E80_07060 [Desulfovibrionaceae bacterium]|nr:hypothetical protein [Desulfovibrionaceae bacterium]